MSIINRGPFIYRHVPIEMHAENGTELAAFALPYSRTRAQRTDRQLLQLPKHEDQIPTFGEDARRFILAEIADKTRFYSRGEFDFKSRIGRT
ncbi:hypothetical protein Zmor_009268 [Zophobas morio]|uniref:Uncharacterized protein n=1 Tax=Zophobas morio TaxID=2755281 RepID=A0AA38III6_9CUCU|nr:hypothetical protein Zmor_009268 [Zophobas morio]